MNKQRLFSGVQPSGRLHIGNYLGAIKNWVELQDEYEAIFCVVDLHAITVPQDPEVLHQRTIESAKAYLAAGIDPERSSIFVQSHVAQHSELAWILNTIARMGDLDKMTQFKDKSDNQETSSIGLYDYPVLMAADILLYDTHVVPVGDDQLQHLELTRTLARRFNKRFGDVFMVPKPYVREESARIMSLDDPMKKMSKSASSEYSYIALDDEPDTARKKIMKALTDSGSEIEYSDEKPALKNLINIYSLLSGKTTKEVERMYQGKGYGDFKKGLADVVEAFFRFYQERYNAISDEEVRAVLERGAVTAKDIASRKMEEVKEKIGFVV